MQINLLQRQREIKTCTLVHFTFRPYSSAVPMNDALHDRKTDSRTFKLIRRMKTLKDTE
jgi:hypothetical protein